MEDDQERQHFDFNASSPSVSEDEDEVEEGEITETRVKKIKFKLGNQDGDVKKRVCEICQRSFSSGKALGGHMRVHNSYQEVNRNPKLKVKPKNMKKMKMRLMLEIPSSSSNPRCADSDPDANPSCALCKKTFPSMKSLFGHMRCHPEREWRGIRPPTKKAISNSSTSTVEEEDDTQIVSSPPASFNLPSWSLTAKRGRKSLQGSSTSVSFSDSDQQLQEEKKPQSLSNLMMLAHYAHLESLNFDSSSSSLPNKKTFDLLEVMKRKLGYDEESDVDSLGSAKKVKLREVEEMEYRCSTCNKCFGSHQALGGHRSKLCKNIFNAAYEDDEDPMNIGSNGSPSKQQLHTCQICDKSFPTGQALGGHKRCHWNGPLPVEALPPPALPPATVTATSSVASKEDEEAANKKRFMFDLNELPMMEDEQGGEGEGYCASS
ncbi:hypothetical protein ACHQM5_006767 [Ranunculus cassubicifolius]